MKFGKEIKAGLIALASIVGFVLMYQFTKGKNFWSSENTYYVKYQDVQGLAPSTPVSINGIRVGQVDKIQPVSDPQKGFYSIVTILVDDEFEFSDQTTAEIFKPDLMGKYEVKLNINYQGEMLKNGDYIQGKAETSMINELTSQVGPLKDQLQSVLKRVDSLSNNANKVFDERNRAEIKMLLGNLNRTTTAFEGLGKSTNALVSTNDKKIASLLNNADKTMNSANNAINEYGKLANELDVQKLNQTVASLDQTVKSLNTVMTSINNGEGSLGKLMKDENLYNNLEATTKNLNGLVEDLKENPKKYINISIFGKK